MSWLGKFLDPLGITGTGGSLKTAWDPLSLATKDKNSGSSSGAQSGDIDPSLEAELMGYFNSEPAFAQTWGSAEQSGGRSAAQWMYDHIKEHPGDPKTGDLAKFNNFVNKTGQYSADGGATGDAVPLEQDLLQRTLQDYIYPDLALDPSRVAEANGIKDRVNAGIDQALAVNRDSLDGTRLRQEYGQAGDTRTRLTDSTNVEAGSLRDALDKMDKQRRDALAPLLAARTNEAETAVAAVNQGLESERDRLTAEQAMQGFYGGSSMDDASQVRATIAARQAAAQLLGQAGVANATDTRGIGDDTARSGFDISGRQAAGVKNATDTETNMRQGYFDNDYTRRLDAALRVPGLESSRFGAMTAADSMRNTGLNRSLGLLDWFSGGSAPPSSQPYYQQPSQSGSDLAGLGTGIFQGAINVGNANKWWQTPTTTTPYSSTNAGMLANGAPSAVASRYGL